MSAASESRSRKLRDLHRSAWKMRDAIFDDCEVARRSYGTGALYVRRDARGRETWYGKWRVGGAAGQMRKTRRGPPEPGTRVGPDPTAGRARTAPADRATVPDARVGERLHRSRRLGAPLPRPHGDARAHAARRCMTYAVAILRVHLDPVLRRPCPWTPSTPVTSRRLIRVNAARGQVAGRRSTCISLALLYGDVPVTPSSAGSRECNPVELADRPRQTRTDADIRFLTIEELEALLAGRAGRRAGPRPSTPSYLTAAMTGMRQGELRRASLARRRLASGVDPRAAAATATASSGTPKTRRSSRAVPMADRVAAELERHYQRADFQGDDELVFCHPAPGERLRPLEAAQALQTRAVARPECATVRFHDLRHTFGTQMAAAGAPLRAIQEWMGHQRLPHHLDLRRLRASGS